MSQNHLQENPNLELWLTLFRELMAEMRARRTAEYNYTAAAIAAFGAFAWGVAALSNRTTPPVLAAVAAILGITASVTWKIVDEHAKHFAFHKQAVTLAQSIATGSRLDKCKLPVTFLRSPEPGAGYLWSLHVLMIGGLGAAVFCISILVPLIAVLLLAIAGGATIGVVHKLMKRKDRLLLVGTPVKGSVVKGDRIASGQNPASPFPRGSIAPQMEIFRKFGLDLSHCMPATLNVSIEPRSFRIRRPSYFFPEVKWSDQHPPEHFSLSPCKLLFGTDSYDAFVYYPHPETKRAHFKPATVLEILAPSVQGIKNDSAVELRLNPSEVLVYGPLATRVRAWFCRRRLRSKSAGRAA